MDTSLPSSSLTGTAPAQRASGASNSWLREPLLHFLLLGAALFAADQVLVGRADDPRRIVVGAEVDAEARSTFKAARGREPTADELKALRRVWLDNELLYREGLALQVDKGDSAIRERVIFKSISVIEANLRPPAVTEPALRAWFEQHRAKYDEPARYDFLEAALSGDSSEAAARAFVQQLNTGTPGDAKAGLRVFKGRPHANIVDSYGAEFAKALEAATPGEWRALPTRDGWRVMRLEAISPAKPAQFEPLRGVVQQDWIDATMSELRTAQVRALAQKFTVVDSNGAKLP